jgi:hypothetical protein
MDMPQGKTEPQDSGIRKKVEHTPRQKFGYAESEHATAEKYSPVFLGAGGENLVYEIPGRPDLVVKANKKTIYDTLVKDPMSDVYTEEDIGRSGALRELKTKLEYDRDALRELREYFGGHLLKQRKFLKKVPVTQDILKGIEDQFDAKGRNANIFPTDAQEAWTILTLQEKITLPENALAPNTAYVERAFVERKWDKDAVKREEYEKNTDMLLNSETVLETTGEDFIKFMRMEPLAKLAERMKSDDGLRAAVKDFVTRAIAYASDTGEVLDVVGSGNIVFYQQDGAWTYLLVDPIYPFDDHVLKRGREAYTSGKSRTEFSGREMNTLLHSVVFTRYINGLALLLNEMELDSKKSGEREYIEYLDFLPKERLDRSMSELMFAPMQDKSRAAA